MPPRYIAVPFVAGGGFQPITTPVLTATVISSSRIDLSLAYTPPPPSSSFAFEQAPGPAGPWTPIASQASSAFSALGLSQNTTYSFRGRVQVVDGRFSSYSNIITLATLSSQPGQVQNLVVNLSGLTTAVLTWNEPPFAQTYNVYRDDELLASLLALTPRTYTDSGLDQGTTYSYTVSSSNASGEGSVSAPGVITTPPAVPTNLHVTSITSNSISLDWDDALGAESYNLYRNGVLVQNLAITNFSDTGRTASTTYNYTVQSVDSSGTTSAITSPSVPGTTSAAGTGFAFQPGHLLCLGFGKSDATQLKALIDAVRTKATGIQISLYPSKYDHGTTVGVHDFGSFADVSFGRGFIKDILDYAWHGGVNPVYVGIVMEERTFGGAISSVPNAFPANWYNFDSYHQSTSSSSSSTRGRIICNTWLDNSKPTPTLTSRGSPQSIATMYDITTMNLYKDICVDIATNFDTHPALIYFGPSGESAVSVGFTSGQLSTYFNNLLAMFQSLRTNFVTTPLRWQLNNISDPTLLSIFPTMMAIPGIIIGGPDPEGQNAHSGFPADPLNASQLSVNRVIQGWDRFRGQSGSTWPFTSGWGPDYRDLQGFAAEFQVFDTVGRTPSPIALWHVSQFLPQKNHYWVWGLSSGNSGFAQGAVLTFIQSINNQTYNVRPSRW